MQNVMDLYWEKKIKTCKDACEKNNFDVYTAKNKNEVEKVILDEILPGLNCKSVSWGDSISMISTKIIDKIETLPHITLIKTFEDGVSKAEIHERRRQALQVDLFLTGSNAITESGKLVNLDMVGNRVTGITFGPKNVIIVIGRNKIVKGMKEAMERVKNYAAPLNAIRHPDLRTPCIKTGYCMDCKSPDRICNTWTITEKSYPKGRIKIIMVNEDLGL